MSTNTLPGALPEEIRRQVTALRLHAERPLIISDADEVLLQFVRALEDFLDAEGLHLALTSFALTGNIRRRATDEALPGPEVRELLRRSPVPKLPTSQSSTGV